MLLNNEYGGVNCPEAENSEPRRGKIGLSVELRARVRFKLTLLQLPVDIYLSLIHISSDKVITRIVLFEGRMISLMGAVIGVALCLILCFIQQEFGLLSLGGGNSGGNFVVDAYPVSVHAWDIVIVFVTVLVVGFLSVWYPVRYLSRRLLGR